MFPWNLRDEYSRHARGIQTVASGGARPALGEEAIDIVACVTPDEDLLGAVLRHIPDVV